MEMKVFYKKGRGAAGRNRRRSFLAAAVLLMVTIGCLFQGTTIMAWAAEGGNTLEGSQDGTTKAVADVRKNADGTYTLSLEVAGADAAAGLAVSGKLAQWLQAEKIDGAQTSFTYMVMDEKGSVTDTPQEMQTAVYDAATDTLSWTFDQDASFQEEYTYVLKVLISFRQTSVTLPASEGEEEKTQQVWLFKADADTEELLEGAVFSLAEELDGVFQDIREITVSIQGCDLGNLAYGKYMLTELVEPEGYTALDEEWTFVVDENGVRLLEGLDSGKLTAENGMCAITIYNINSNSSNDNARLPSTGGEGTSAYVVGGLLLMIGTMIGLFVIKTRQIYD